MTHRHLSAAQLDELRGLLQTRRAETLAQGGRLDGSLATVRAARSDGAADDEHDPEGPTMSSEWSRLAGTREAVDSELRAIDDAVARIDSGGYGLCARCGESIPVDRLRARPEATLCMACAAAMGA